MVRADLSCVITLLPVLSPHQVVREVGAYQTGTNALQEDKYISRSVSPDFHKCHNPRVDVKDMRLIPKRIASCSQILDPLTTLRLYFAIGQVGAAVKYELYDTNK